MEVTTALKPCHDKMSCGRRTVGRRLRLRLRRALHATRLLRGTGRAQDWGRTKRYAESCHYNFSMKLPT